jgi:hypothetical protein
VDEIEGEEPTEKPDMNGRMPGQLPSAGSKISALVGKEVTVGTQKNGSMK